MSDLPAGNVTFLFTDVEGSTRLFQQHPEAMKRALAQHDAIVQRAITGHHGHIFQQLGDGFCAAFARPADALQAALDAQRALHGESWGPVGSLRVRMGLHSGNAEVHDGQYATSLTLARTQRVSAAGHGGQVLLSSATAAAVRDSLPRSITLRDLGAHKLRGIAQPETLHELVAPDLPSGFPPPRVEESVVASATPLERLVRGRLVGRATEEAQLRQRWADAQQSRAQLVLVSGEPGVGKTRLATEIVEYARKSGATILRGGCYEFEATTPYLPFVEAFREWTHWQSIDTLKSVVNGTPQIVKLAPEIELRAGPAPAAAALSSVEERLRLFDNIARFVESLAADNGLLVFIDDLHWADQGTLSLLHYLARQLRHRRVMVLATYRETELDRTHPLSAALVDWNRDRLAVRVSLGRLPREATAEMLCTLFGVKEISDELVDALYKETEGNPFFVEEVIKSLIEQGEIFREGDEWSRKATNELSIPQSVKEAIGRRLTRLTAPTVDVLRTAAALGKHFAFRDLVAVTESGEDPLLDALDEATAAQLVKPGGRDLVSGDDEGFVFTHDKIREVLYEELNPIRRRRLHQRIGEALERLHGQSPDDAASADTTGVQDLAHHFALAGDLKRSLAYALRAARHAARVSAQDEALKYLEQARESADAQHRPELVGDIDVEIGHTQDIRGVTHEAVAAYERAIPNARSDADRAALRAHIGSAYATIGDPRGLPYLERALAELDPVTQPAALALATGTMGRYYHYRVEHTKALEIIQRAYDIAKPLDDPNLLAQIMPHLMGTYQHLLRFDEGDHWAREAIALGERHRIPEAIAMGHEFLGENASARGFWLESLPHGHKDAEFGEKAGSLSRIAWAQFTLVQAYVGLGELAAARAAAEHGLALCEQIGENRLACWLQPAIAEIAAYQGDRETAEAMAKAGWARAEGLGQLVLSAWALVANAIVALTRGDLDGARQWSVRYLDLVADTENGICKISSLPRAANVLFEAGDFERAARTAQMAVEFAEFGGSKHWRACARRVQALLLARDGRAEDALGMLDDVVEELTRGKSRLEAARTLRWRAEIRLAYEPIRDRDAARRDAERARDEFVALGAGYDARIVERLLATA